MDAKRPRFQIGLRHFLVLSLVLPPILAQLAVRIQKSWAETSDLGKSRTTSTNRPFPYSGPLFEVGPPNEPADCVLYDNEFELGTDHFSPRGRRHLEEIAYRWSQSSCCITIEASPFNFNPVLDQMRRQAVMELMVRLGAEDVECRTIIANPSDVLVDSTDLPPIGSSDGRNFPLPKP